MADDWTDDENDAIVEDYFAMLAEDVARRPYNKAQHNRVLQTVIDRPRGSIEYKHQNISAALKGLGEDLRATRAAQGPCLADGDELSGEVAVEDRTSARPR